MSMHPAIEWAVSSSLVVASEEQENPAPKARGEGRGGGVLVVE